MDIGAKLRVASVFDLKGIPAFRQFYDAGIARWSRIYRGEASWTRRRCPTIADCGKTRAAMRLDVARVAAREMANLTWAEGVRIDFADETTGEFVNGVLDANNFRDSMRKLTERAYALGGAAVKLYAEADGRIVLQYVPADKVIPISWDGASVSEAVFIDKRAENGLYYTRLEFHTREDGVYTVSNRLFCSDRQDILGEECPLAILYENLAYDAQIENMDGALFAYFAPNNANTLDPNSPLGMSVFAGAEDTLKAIDEVYDSLWQEFRLGRRRIIIPASAARPVIQADGSQRRMFDADDAVYEALLLDGPEAQKIHDNTVGLRVAEHIQALNSLLGIFSTQCGLSVGSLSFDRAEGLRTATEVVSNDSKTFRTIKMHQESVRRAVEVVVNGIMSLGELYGTGRRSDFRVSFPDAVIEDTEARTRRGLELVREGVISKRTFLEQYMGLTAEGADKELKLVEAEGAKLDGMFAE